MPPGAAVDAGKAVPRKATGVFTHQVNTVMSENSSQILDGYGLSPVNALYGLFYKNLNMFMRQNTCSLPTEKWTKSSQFGDEPI